MNKLIYFVFLVLGYISTQAQTGHKYVDTQIMNYNSVDNNVQYRISKNLASYASKLDDTIATKELMKRIIQVTSNVSSKFHVQSIFYYSRQLMYFNDVAGFEAQWNLGASLAKKYDFTFELGDFFMLKAEYFQKEKRYDSLLIYALKSEKCFETIGDSDKIASINHILGDVYYKIELYEDAERFYQKAMLFKGELTYWKKYREYVVLNNLGLIYYNKSDFQKAFEYFSNGMKSIEDILKKDTQKTFFNRYAYSQIRLASCYSKFGEYNKAYKLFQSANNYIQANFPECEHYSLFWNYYTVGGEVYLNLGINDSAYVYITKAIRYSKKNNDNKDLMQAYRLMSVYYQKIGDFKKSNEFLNLAFEVDGLIKNKNYLSRFYQIKAQNDYLNGLYELEKRDLKIKILFYSISILLILLLVIVLLYYKVSKSNKKLVEKTVEIVKNDQISKGKLFENSIQQQSIATLDTSISEMTTEETHDIESEDSNSLSEEIASEEDCIETPDFLKELASKIDNIIVKEKLYLKNDFSINDLSKKIKVNRTYISKAVNNYLSDNFKGYLNDLRIKEALLLLADDKNDKFTLEAIYENAGFNNRNSFNRAFLKQTGVTPSYYQKNRHLFEIDK